MGAPLNTEMSAKALLRRELLAARRLLTGEAVERAAEALASRALTLPELSGARTVAAYVSVGREPGTRALLDALRARGVRVLLPVLLPDNDLDWAPYEGAGSLAQAGRGLLGRPGSGSAPTPYWTPTRCCCRASRWTGAGCGSAGAAAATTGCWPGSRRPGRTRR